MKEKKENQNPSIKILVGYHKPAELLKDDILTPIHLGRVLATEASKDGSISRDDYEWMCKNMIGDDTGDNISHLNRYFCELTGIYWAWKNYDKLGNPDYIGFMHYRRQFIFDESKVENLSIHENGWPWVIRTSQDQFPSYNKHDILKHLDDGRIDMFIPKFFELNSPFNDNFYKFDTIEDWYPGEKLFIQNRNLTIGHYLYKYILDTSAEFSEYKSLANKYFLECGYYPCNVFILKKEVFFEYCNFLFKLLFIVYEILEKNLKIRNLHEAREPGYCAELITTIFFLKKIKEGKKYKELYLFWNDGIFLNYDSFYVGAEDRVRRHLSYQVGNLIIQDVKTPKILILPFKIFFLCLKYFILKIA
ncbi:DUF4422 domain-containing protein, partial [Campylobacter jejuni]|nr:DUF4422 domain-containing protein [Campylobacter jejuni]ECP7425921.1 DUF4422 domain-containing protein [Campylobacter jejuni]